MAYVTVAAMGMQVVSAISNAQSIQSSAAIQNQVAQVNAKYAQLDAYNAVQQGDTQAARYQTAIDQTVGAAKEGMAANNVDVNFGTGSEITAQSKLNGYLNTLQMKQQAAQKALGYNTQANNIILGGETGQISANAKSTAALFTGAAGAAAVGASGYAKAYADPTAESDTWENGYGDKV